MTYQNILEIAEEKLNDDFKNVVEDLKREITYGSTGGEITSIVGKYLKDLEKNNYQAFDILKDDIDKYLLSCKRQGITII